MNNSFRSFLETEGLTANGVAYRVTNANKAESFLGRNLDTIVANDMTMEIALRDLRAIDKKRAPLQNALRKYYKFSNGKEFPKLRKCLIVC